MATKNIVPRTGSQGGIGTDAKPWKEAIFDTGSYGVISSSLKPDADNTYDLGHGSSRWRNVYTYDLNLNNEGSQNDVDGTWGSWTIQEGQDDLFLLNRRNGKKYKFNLTEVS